MDEANVALRDIQMARIAIFNGEPDKARTLVVGAVDNLTTAQSNAKTFTVPTAKSKSAGDDYIPFDSTISLAEGFKPTDEKAATVAKANEHLATGDSVTAVETLKAANIDVTISAALIPINTSLGHTKDAANLINEGKYYEANLALKAVEDSVIIDAYSVDCRAEARLNTKAHEQSPGPAGPGFT